MRRAPAPIYVRRPFIPARTRRSLPSNRHQRGVLWPQSCSIDQVAIGIIGVVRRVLERISDAEQAVVRVVESSGDLAKLVLNGGNSRAVTGLGRGKEFKACSL